MLIIERNLSVQWEAPCNDSFIDAAWAVRDIVQQRDSNLKPNTMQSPIFSWSPLQKKSVALAELSQGSFISKTRLWQHHQICILSSKFLCHQCCALLRPLALFATHQGSGGQSSYASLVHFYFNRVVESYDKCGDCPWRGGTNNF